VLLHFKHYICNEVNLISENDRAQITTLLTIQPEFQKKTVTNATNNISKVMHPNGLLNGVSPH
jgi:hypothetical protein